MAINWVENRLDTRGDHELRATLITQDRQNGNGHMPFSRPVELALATDLLTNWMGYAPIQYGILGQPSGPLHHINLSAALFNISVQRNLPKNVAEKLQKAVADHDPESIIRKQDGMGIFTKVVERRQRSQILHPASLVLSPQHVLPALMGTDWNSPSMQVNRGLILSQKDADVAERVSFFTSHDVAVQTLPIKPICDEQTLQSLIANDQQFMRLLEILNQKVVAPKDLQPDFFGLPSSSSLADFQMAIYLIFLAYRRTAQSNKRAGVSDSDVLIQDPQGVIDRTRGYLLNEVLRGEGEELVVILSYLL
jgi:hypothetical protein